MSVSGECLVVGATLGDDNGFDSGCAYVFRLNLDTEEWVEQKLTASDGAAGDIFGVSVSVSGEHLVVGALQDDDDGEESGSAYVFRFDSDTEEWEEEQKLTASDAAEDDFFGISVSIFGERLVVGAFNGDDDPGDDNGSAYVFHLDPDSEEWVELQKLTASEGAENGWFGWSVSI